VLRVCMCGSGDAVAGGCFVVLCVVGVVGVVGVVCWLSFNHKTPCLSGLFNHQHHSLGASCRLAPPGARYRSPGPLVPRNRPVRRQNVAMGTTLRRGGEFPV